MHHSERRRVKWYGATRERVQHDAEAPHVDRCGGVRRLGSICFCRRGGEQQLRRRAVLRTCTLRERARERRGARKVGEDGLPGEVDVNIIDFEVYSMNEQRHGEALRLFGRVKKEERRTLAAVHHAVFVEKP